MIVILDIFTPVTSQIGATNVHMYVFAWWITMFLRPIKFTTIHRRGDFHSALFLFSTPNLIRHLDCNGILFFSPITKILLLQLRTFFSTISFRRMGKQFHCSPLKMINDWDKKKTKKGIPNPWQIKFSKLNCSLKARKTKFKI